MFPARVPASSVTTRSKPPLVAVNKTPAGTHYVDSLEHLDGQYPRKEAFESSSSLHGDHPQPVS